MIMIDNIREKTKQEVSLRGQVLNFVGAGPTK